MMATAMADRRGEANATNNRGLPESHPPEALGAGQKAKGAVSR